MSEPRRKAPKTRRTPFKKNLSSPTPTEPATGPSDQSNSTRTRLHQLCPTEADLAKIGLAVDEPSAQNSEHQDVEGVQVVGADADKKPDPSWTVEQLASYAKGKMASSAQAEKEAILQAHKSAVDLFWAGAALWLIRDKLKKEERWVAWQKANKLARSTVLEAIALYENTMSPDALVGLGITEAKERFGVVRPKPTPRPPQRTDHWPGNPRQPIEAKPNNAKPNNAKPTDPLPAVDYEGQLREKVQAAVSNLESWTLNDLGRVVISAEQRTTWKNLAASLRAAAKRIEDYLAKKSIKKGKERAA
jgi:hypothetical protein